MIQVSLETNNVYVSEKCFICGEWFDAGVVLPTAWDESGKVVGYICPECLQESNVRDKLVTRAETLLGYATLLLYLARQDFKLPSYEEYKDAVRAAAWKEFVKVVLVNVRAKVTSGAFRKALKLLITR